MPFHSALGSPAADLVQRMDAARPLVRVRLGMPRGPAAGWVRCADVLDDPAHLPAWLGRVTAMVTAHEGGGYVPPAVTPASYLMGWYLDVVASAGASAFAVARRVPELGPAALALHEHPAGYPDGVALLSSRFACLPDDRDAGHPDAEVVADEAALAGVLRDRVAEHARAFHAVYRPEAKISSLQRWGMLTDVLDAALGVDDAALVLDDVHPPYTAPTGAYRLTDHRGRAWWGSRRQSCCFFFRVPSGHECFACPRVDDAERASRASGWTDDGPLPRA